MRGRGGRNVFSSLRSLLFISPLDEPVDWEEWREEKERGEEEEEQGGGGHSSQEHLLPPLLSPYISLSIVSCVKLMGCRTDAPRSSAALMNGAVVSVIVQLLCCCSLTPH